MKWAKTKCASVRSGTSRCHFRHPYSRVLEVLAIAINQEEEIKGHPQSNQAYSYLTAWVLVSLPSYIHRALVAGSLTPETAWHAEGPYNRIRTSLAVTA